MRQSRQSLPAILYDEWDADAAAIVRAPYRCASTSVEHDEQWSTDVLIRHAAIVAKSVPLRAPARSARYSADSARAMSSTSRRA